MKTIQWFPGHMAKAMRMMEESLSLVDAVAIVLDARAPAATFNRRLRDLAGNKPLLYILNKSDLADGGAEAIRSAIMSSGGKAVCVSATTGGSSRALVTAMQSLVAEKAAREAEKGNRRAMRFLVAGVPNTGKSTVINLLSGTKRAVTGDKAGVTRGKQWVHCGAFDLMDTPGTMPPSFDDQRLARRLAFIGSVNDDTLEKDEIALELLGELGEKYPELLRERYGLTQFDDKVAMLEGVCRRRGMIVRGGEADYDRGALALIDDFRKGRLGRVCLDTVADAKEAGLA